MAGKVERGREGGRVERGGEGGGPDNGSPVRNILLETKRIVDSISNQ